MESEDDEVPKSARVKKRIGHWQVSSRDNDMTWPCLPALRSFSWPVRRLWFLQIWFASPGAVTCRDFQSYLPVTEYLRH